MRFLPLLFLLALSLQAANPTLTKSVDSIADLRGLLVADKHDTVNVRGYATANDGGQGTFEFEPTSTATADNGIYVAPTVGGGRWKRVVQGRDYLARWWGPTKTNITLQSAMNWVSSNGWGRVIADGGTWLVKGDDTTRLLMQSGVTLTTADDSQIVLAPNPTNNWVLVDFPLDVHDCGVGPARLVGWNLAAPGGDTNKSGLIFSIQDTVNVTIGGVLADNWYTRYADVGSGNVNLQMFDKNWERGIGAFGAKIDGVTDDTTAVQDSVYYAERYSGEVVYPLGTNICLQTTVYITNGVPITIRGSDSKIHFYYSQRGDVTNQRYSAAFMVGSASDNVTFDGLNFRAISTNYNAAIEETFATGYYQAININLATNTVIRNCTFDVPTGRAIISAGSYTDIHQNKFLNGCGITLGVGQPHNWLYFENTIPLGADQVWLSPIGCRITDNYFTGSNNWKHICHFSAADKLTFSRNKMIDIGTPLTALLIYSGDLGTTDARGTNLYEYNGSVTDNTITGNFGTDGAITFRLNTPTNYILDTSFRPDDMVASWIFQNNIISGTGKGYNLINPTGVKLKGGDLRVTEEQLLPLGDCSGFEIDGGYYETTGTSTSGASIIFGNAFLAPSSFGNVKFMNATFVTGQSNEYWMRSVSHSSDNFTVKNCNIKFLGTLGSGDAPRALSMTQCTNFLALIENYFYVTNNVDGQAIVSLSGTNCDFRIHGNQLIKLADTAIPRGVQVSGRRVLAERNAMGSFEVGFADTLLLKGNSFTHGDGFAPLEIDNTRSASIIGNEVLNTNTTSQIAVTIHATNSTFVGNIVQGNSSGELVRAADVGTMYSERNLIFNSGAGLTEVTASGTAVVREHNWIGGSLIVESSTNNVARFHRTTGLGALGIDLDGWFQSFNRDVKYRVIPVSLTDVGGHAFFLAHSNSVEEFAFGAEATLEGAFRVGTPTNAIDFYLGSVLIKQGAGSPEGAVAGPTPSLYFATNGAAGAQYWFKTNGVGNTGWEPLTFGIGSGGGGGTNQTPWLQDIDGGLYLATNIWGITLRHTDATATMLTVSNSASAGSTFGISTLGNVVINSGGPGSMSFQLGGATHMALSLAALTPGGTPKGVGTISDRWSQLAVGSSGVDLNGSLIRSGSGNPEGVEIANPGSLWMRTNGVAGAVLYAKQSGTGNTDWPLVPIQDVWVISLSDLTSVITATTNRAYFRAPFAMKLVSVRAYLLTAQSTGSIVTVDINETGTSVLGTKLSVDNGEEDSRTAAAAATITDSSLADGAKITADVDAVGDGTAKGLMIELVTTRL